MQKNKNRKKRSKEERIIAATLKLAKSNSWKNISMKIISEEAKIPLTEIIKTLPTKTAVLIEFNRLVDKRLTENNPNVVETTNSRDLLFELLMERFDILSENKEALVNIMKSVAKESPVTGIIGIISSLQSINKIMEICAIPNRGLLGKIRLKAVFAIYLKAMYCWLEDDTPGLSKTMADLDKSLTKLEVLLSRLSPTNM